jgi:Zn-dependent protease with chaperone function
MKGLQLYILLLITSFGWAQNPYSLDTLDQPKREAFVKQFEESNKSFFEELEVKYSGKTAKELKKNLKEFNVEFSKEIKEKNFLFDERFLAKVNEILEEFKQKNPEIPQKIRVIVSKNTSLNAYCLPDGTFVVHMGLFYWLNNENQLASVLAHEIAHKILEHPIKSQVRIIEDLNSKTSKQTVRKIKNGWYNKSQKAFELYKDKLYSSRDYQKKNEFQADSLGYLLLKKTKYKSSEFIETLKLMNKYDTIRPEGLHKDIYKKTFNLPNLPFKEDWLKTEDFSKYDYNLYQSRFNKDSLSTHPEMADRIKKMQTLFPELLTSKTEKPTDEFKKLEKLAQYNIVPNLMFFEEYGVAIYICLYHLQKEEDKPYYSKLLGENFTKIYNARKEYKLNRYLEQIEPKNNSESYIQFLSFMWNLSLDEIKAISDYYNKSD